MYKTWLFLLVFSFTQEAFSQWNHHAFFYIPGGPFTPIRMDADFPEPGTGFFAYYVYWSPSSGSSTYEEITTDSGATWNSFASYQSSTGSFGFYHAVPEQKTVYRTITINAAGWHFSSINKSISSPSGSQNVFNGNPLTGIITDLHTTDTSYVYFLSSGLSRISNGVININFCSFPNYNPRKIFFPDSINGYIAGDSIFNDMHSLLKTADGGNNWQNVFQDTAVYIKCMHFTDSQNGNFGGNDGIVYNTTNGGISWQPTIVSTSGDITAIHFVNSSFGFVGTSDGEIFRTTDGGTTWNADLITNTDRIRKIYLLNDSTVIAITEFNAYLSHLLIPVSTEEYHIEKPGIIFPNPASDSFFIRVPDGNSGNRLNLKIYSENGQYVAEYGFKIEDNLIECNFGPLQTGYYIIYGETGIETFSRKILLRCNY